MSVYDQEKSDTDLLPSDDELRSRTGVHRGEEDAIDTATSQGAERDKASGKPTDSKSLSADNLRSAENSAGDSSGPGFYRPGADKGGGGFLKRVFWGSKRRKQATIGGGISGLFMGGGVFAAIFFGGTGFEFIHIAQLLEHSHFGNQQSASNHEMGKLFRYLNSGGDIGETRLTWLESKMKTTMISELKSKGLNPDFKGGTYNGITIDPDQPGPFEGMEPDEIKATLAQKGITSGIEVNADGTVTVTPDDGFLSGYSSKKLSLQTFVGFLDESNTPDAIRWRILAKYGFVTWHPLEIVKNKLNTKAYALAEKAWEKAKDLFDTTGEEPPTLADTAAATTDPDNPKAPPESAGGTQNGVVPDPEAKSLLDKLHASVADSTSFKVAGGVAFAIAMACLANTIDKNIGDFRYAQDILPMMREATDTITAGNQIMSGQDVDTGEMNIMAQQFTSPGSNGQSWADSQTFEADQDEPMTGADLPPSVKDVVNEAGPAWLNWTQNHDVAKVLGPVCGTGGQIISGIASFALGIFSGDAAGTILGFVGGYLAGPYISDFAKLLSGDALNVVKASGPEWGNIVNYGAGFFANAGAVQDGGTQLSSQQVALLNNVQNQATQQTFDSHSIAYRLFNPDDYESLVSRIMDTKSSNNNQNMDNVASDLFGLVGDIFSSPFKLLSSTVRASTPETYNYPFPEYGFSAQDLEAMSGNPYTNAEQVAKYLDNNNPNGNPDYISLVKQCFNDTLTLAPAEPGSSDMVWDVIPGASSNVDALNFYGPSYTALDCNDPGGIPANVWRQIRFFIFDTGVMEGYACEHGDDQSCQNDGISTGSSSSTTASASTSTTTSSSSASTNQSSAKTCVAPSNYPTQPEGGMAYAHWLFNNNSMSSMEDQIKISNNPGPNSDLYLQLYDADIDNTSQYFGLQTSGTAIFTKWGDENKVNVIAGPGSTIVAGVETGTDYVSLRHDFGSLPTGDYSTKVVRTSSDSLGDWFSYYVTFPGKSEVFIGKIRFPRANPSVPAGFKDNGGTWVEFFKNNGSTLYPVPLWHVEVEPTTNGVNPATATSSYAQMPNSDVYADPTGGFVDFVVGGSTPRCHPAGVLWSTS